MDVQLLRSSFDLVVSRQPQLAHRLYEVLFERHPELLKLFTRRPAQEHEARLTKALVQLMAQLDNTAATVAMLHALGGRHVRYGVTEVMYGWVGDALLTVLAEAAGDDWTPALAAEWTAAFGVIAGAMQAGARAVTEAA
jgi:hemoglobin-like flavoprotein